MYTHRYIHRYIHTYSLWSKYCQIPNFWPKTASLTSKFIKIKFPDDLNRFEGHTMYTYRYIGTYIDTYIHIYVMLYDGKSCQIANFWPKTTNLTSKIIIIQFPDDLDRFEVHSMYLHRHINTYIRCCLFCNIENNVCMYVYIFVGTSYVLQTYLNRLEIQFWWILM